MQIRCAADSGTELADSGQKCSRNKSITCQATLLTTTEGRTWQASGPRVQEGDAISWDEVSNRVAVSAGDRKEAAHWQQRSWYTCVIAVQVRTRVFGLSSRLSSLSGEGECQPCSWVHIGRTASKIIYFFLEAAMAATISEQQRAGGMLALLWCIASGWLDV